MFARFAKRPVKEESRIYCILPCSFYVLILCFPASTCLLILLACYFSLLFLLLYVLIRFPDRWHAVWGRSAQWSHRNPPLAHAFLLLSVQEYSYTRMVLVWGQLCLHVSVDHVAADQKHLSDYLSKKLATCSRLGRVPVCFSLVLKNGSSIAGWRWDFGWRCANEWRWTGTGSFDLVWSLGSRASTLSQQL